MEDCYKFWKNRTNEWEKRTYILKVTTKKEEHGSETSLLAVILFVRFNMHY